MLNNVYLSGITNPTSRRYAVITAYNGGAGSVLRVFSSDKVQAANIINTLTPGGCLRNPDQPPSVRGIPPLPV